MAYRLLLGREPESASVIEDHRASRSSRRDLVEHFVASKEFQTAGAPVSTKKKSKDRDDSLAAFLSEWRRDGKKPPSTHWRDPLGVLTSIGCREEFGNRSGRVITETMPADRVEWHALAGALSSASNSFCAVELGAGFGPWLMRAGVAWRAHRGAAPLRLIAVEGEPTHIELLRQHAIDNGLDDCLPDFHWGAVGAVDGHVMFEVATNPTRNWGTRPVAAPEAPSGMQRDPATGQVEVPCWSLATLLRDLPTVDLLHIDIQGSEAMVLAAAEREVAEKVRRIFIGTHGRGIEAELFTRLPALGFELVEERPCSYRVEAGRPLLISDGSQYWARLNG